VSSFFFFLISVWFGFTFHCLYLWLCFIDLIYFLLPLIGFIFLHKQFLYRNSVHFLILKLHVAFAWIIAPNKHLHFISRILDSVCCFPPLYITLHRKDLLWSMCVGRKVSIDVIFHWPSVSICDWRSFSPEWLQVILGGEKGQEWVTEQEADTDWFSLRSSVKANLMGLGSPVFTREITIGNYKMFYVISSFKRSQLSWMLNTFVNNKISESCFKA